MPNFLRPHQIFQEIQGFIVFLCGNIFSNFSRLHLIILAKSWWNFTWIRQNRNKKKKFRQKNVKFTRFLCPPSNFPRKSRFYCVFMWQYFSNFCSSELFFFIKFLKRFRYRCENVAQKRSKKGELGSNLT